MLTDNPIDNKNIEEIQQAFISALASIGFRYIPYKTDLLEVITYLTDELNKTKAELYDLKLEMFDKITSIEKDLR